MTCFEEISQFLYSQGFNKYINAEYRHSISDCFLKSDIVCGIYVLRFANGEYYVGQSIDVTKRFLQHKKNHNDIIGVFFKIVDKGQLDTVEQDMIAEMETRVTLRNISYASMPKLLNTDLDMLIPHEKQQLWLAQERHEINTTCRVDDEGLRKRYERETSRLLSDDIFCKYHLPMLQKYISKCIIEPLLTELTYWECSCLLDNEKGLFLYCRINVNFQEICTCSKDADGPIQTWHVAKNPFDRNPSALKDFKDIELTDHRYASGGKDQCGIISFNPDESMALLDNPTFLEAAKTFSLTRMRKGASPYAKTHSLPLADAILAGVLSQ